MPTENKLEDTTTEEVSKILSGNALDNEIRAFEGIHAAPKQQQQTKSEDKGIDDNQQRVSEKDTKVGEGKHEKVSEIKKEDTHKSSLKSFDELIGSNFSKEIKKDDKTKEAVENTKVEDTKKESGIKLDEDGKPIRNLEGFGDQEKIWLKRMPYEAYEYFSKTLKEKRELDNRFKEETKKLTDKVTALESGKQILPESYYDNPNAFILSPEFGKIQYNAQLSKQVEEHWTEQLRKFKKGENWTPLTNDPKTGELLFDDEREYNADDEVYILRQLNGANQQVVKFNSELERFVGGFQESHKSYISKIRQVEKEMLPVFENKESVEYKTYEAIKPKVEAWGIRKDNPAFEMLTKAVALNLVFRDALLGILQQQQQTKSLKEEQVKAGPTASSFSGGGSANNELNKPKISDFNKVLYPNQF